MILEESSETVRNITDREEITQPRETRWTSNPQNPSVFITNEELLAHGP